MNNLKKLKIKNKISINKQLKINKKEIQQISTLIFKINQKQIRLNKERKHRKGKIIYRMILLQIFKI